MKHLNRKPNRNAGFTLVEMLIVVAIIAILIAVSIPLVGSALEKARDNTDLANERAAKAEAAMAFMGVGAIYQGTDGSTKATNFEDGAFGYANANRASAVNVTVYYDATNGRLQLGTPGGYGQCTKAATTNNANESKCDAGSGVTFQGKNTNGTGHADKYLTVQVDDNGTVTLTWTKA